MYRTLNGEKRPSDYERLGDHITRQAEQIGIEYLPQKVMASPASAEPGDLVSLERLEEMHIRRVLAATKSLQEAADILGIDQTTLWRRRKQYNI